MWPTGKPAVLSLLSWHVLGCESVVVKYRYGLTLYCSEFSRLRSARVPRRSSRQADLRTRAGL